MKLKELLLDICVEEDITIEDEEEIKLADTQYYSDVYKYLDCDVIQISTKGYDHLFIRINTNNKLESKS